MNSRYLLDTHVFVRWVQDSRRLSRTQLRAMRESERLMEPFALSAISLLEIAVLSRSSRSKREVPIQELFHLLRTSPAYDVLPVTLDIAEEYAALSGSIPDPADRAIVATARVHGLTLLTSDQRIIDSRLVPVID